MQLFISHIHEERTIAATIRDELYSCFGAQVEVFLAEDIPLGTNWFDEIKSALGRSDVLIVLFSKYSSSRPWINIEAGYGVMAGKKVIPICHSGFSKTDLPVIYGLLQAIDLLDTKDIGRLLDQIARETQAGQFLGDKSGSVSRWIDKVSHAVRSTPRFAQPLNTAPCIWIIGSNRGLGPKQSVFNKRFVTFLAQALMQRCFRVVFGRSRLLDILGESLNQEVDRSQVYGVDRDTLTEFSSTSAMYKDVPKSAPNPVVVLGSFRSDRGLSEVFMESIGHSPDIAVVIGGALTGRTREEVEHAKAAGIPVLPISFTGGVAATIEWSGDSSLLDRVIKIQHAKRDYSSIAQSICDVLEAQTVIKRNL
jgi:TIR domain-containing protein